MLVFFLSILISIVSTIVIVLISRYKLNTKINTIETKYEICKQSLETKKKELNTLDNEKINLITKISSLESENKFLNQRLKEKKDELEELTKKMNTEFKNLAQNILEEKSKKFTLQNKENIETILKPLNQKIIDFQNQIDQTNKEDLARTIALKTEIQKLNDLNIQVTKDATALTKAIKGDSKTQGNWGEVILEKILEKSGLRAGFEYFVQESFINEVGKRYRPDVIIKLPDDKNIVIDAKVSLTDYERSINTDIDKDKDLYVKKHLLSIKAHIKNLSQKNYHIEYNLRSLDFVLMFIPIEPAFSCAIQNDHNIFNEAYNKNIVIVSPTTLIATLKTINSIWKTEYQNKNVLEIARQGGALYDKFVGFIDDFKAIKDRISSLEKSYISAGKKLYEGRDNLVIKSEKLKVLGAKTTKIIPPQLVEKASKEASLSNTI